MFWKSNGLVRGIGFGFTFFGNFVAPHIPVLSPFSEGIVYIGTALTGAGTVNAMLR